MSDTPPRIRRYREALKNAISQLEHPPLVFQEPMDGVPYDCAATAQFDACPAAEVMLMTLQQWRWLERMTGAATRYTNMIGTFGLHGHVNITAISLGGFPCGSNMIVWDGEN